MFTSALLPGARSPGDWGSIALVGHAPGNWGASNGVVVTQHVPDANDWPGGFPYVAGGDQPNDSSGTMKYVRIEYGGAPKNQAVTTDHEMLGLYGVGSGTTIEYIDKHDDYMKVLIERATAFMLCVAMKTPPVELPPVPAPIDPTRVVDMSENNQWGNSAFDWKHNKPAYDAYNEAKENLKDLTPADAKRAFGHGVQVTRAKNGALTVRLDN